MTFRRLSAVLVLSSGLCLASSITQVTILGGTWSGTTFSPNGLNWNNYDPGSWSLGVTAPSLGSPLLNPSGTLNVPEGNYYLFMSGRDSFATWGSTALKISLGTSSAVFTLGPGGYSQPGYTLVSGSGVEADAIIPPSDQDLVGQFQSYTPDGLADWVVDARSVPEPGTFALIGAALIALGSRLRRKR